MSESVKATSASSAASKGALDGDDLRTAFQVGTRYLERHRDAINALNVFPVPDGDTGTNMLLTMRSVNDAASRDSGSSAGAVTAAMAHGALLGARGNSGVILSQFFHGLAKGFEGKQELDVEDLVQALKLASGAANRSVSKPVDGTMLTVIGELSLAASRHVGGLGDYGDVVSTWRAALEAAKEALSRTPLQLPVLRQAGVVDAGGQGVVTLLEGAWLHLSGEEVDGLELELCVPEGSDGGLGGVSLDGARAMVHEEFLAATEAELYGYCTQFLIHGHELDVDAIRERLSSIAESTVVVGEESLVKVHVHAIDPGPVISYAVSLGTVGGVTLENIDQQHQEFVAHHRAQPGVADPPAREVLSSHAVHVADGDAITVAAVAVAWGNGFARLFEELGCAAVVAGGQTMNPSTQELLDAAGNARASDVILLPNNPNIIPAARQAASLAGTDYGAGTRYGKTARLHVIPSRSIPQGVAALLAFNREFPLEGNLESMERALETVKTIEVTKAVRPATVGGVTVHEGQHIGLLEGDLVVAGDSAFSALWQTLDACSMRSGQLVTLYWGGELEESEAVDASVRLRESVPGLEVELVYGGQPHYHFVASLE